ncbi:MAG TPA: TetR family transcriptional regulator [Puia sp.]|jgi:AcrR family transcriptional regulator
MAEGKKQIDASTEEKIISAAKKIFTQKGYEGAKVRDIAAEADIHVSQVNYYFRSKEKLFEVIMTDNIDNLFDKISPVLMDEHTTLNDKIKLAAGLYIDMLLENPAFPRFIVNEVLSGTNKIPAIAAKQDFIRKSHFAKQVLAIKAEGKIDYHPFQILLNLISLIVFPFLGKTLFDKTVQSKDGFRQMMEERKRLIPIWIDSMIAA